MHVFGSPRLGSTPFLSDGRQACMLEVHPPPVFADHRGGHGMEGGGGSARLHDAFHPADVFFVDVACSSPWVQPRCSLAQVPVEVVFGGHCEEQIPCGIRSIRQAVIEQQEVVQSASEAIRLIS